MDASLVHAIYWLLLVFAVLGAYAVCWYKAEESFSFKPWIAMLGGLFYVLSAIACIFVWLILAVTLGILLYAIGYAVWLCVLVAFCTILAFPGVLYIVAWAVSSVVLIVVMACRGMKHQIRKIRMCRKQKNKKE